MKSATITFMLLPGHIGHLYGERLATASLGSHLDCHSPHGHTRSRCDRMNSTEMLYIEMIHSMILFQIFSHHNSYFNANSHNDCRWWYSART